jgi:hypothetical protein
MSHYPTRLRQLERAQRLRRLFRVIVLASHGKRRQLRQLFDSRLGAQADFSAAIKRRVGAGVALDAIRGLSWLLAKPRALRLRTFSSPRFDGPCGRPLPPKRSCTCVER